MEQSTEQFRVNRLPPFLLGEVAQAVIRARSSGRDIVDLSQLNPNLGPPAAAVEKLVQASLQPHNHRYSSSHGIAKLRSAVTAWYGRRYGVELSPDDETLVTMGTKQGISHLLFAVANPGDTILLPSPAYPIHTAAAVLAGANVAGVDLPSPESCGGVLDGSNDEFFSRLIHSFEASWPRPRMMLLSFPHNPTSLVATRCFFERLVELAKERSFYLLHDFAYADIGYEENATPSLLSIPGAIEVAVEFTSFSKGLSMPGWRVGSCCGNPRLVQALRKIKSYLDYGVFQPLQIAAIQALHGYDAVIAETLDIYRARRDVLAAGLPELGFSFVEPKGGLFLWARLPEVLRLEGSLQASMRVLNEANLAVCPGAGFDPHADEYVRFAFVEPEARIRSALQQLGAFLGRKQ